MHKIIYASPNKIEWDAQSAFKITNYYTEAENHMIYCYLKQYVQSGDLKLCTFCFDSTAAGKSDFQLCINLNPTCTRSFLLAEFGIDGINSASILNPDTQQIAAVPSDIIEYRSFKTNDQQGFYWCGELSLSQSFISEYFNTTLKEESIVSLNLYKTFSNNFDYACLFPDSEKTPFAMGEYLQPFVVLDY